MKIVTDEALYHMHTKALLSQLVKETIQVLEQYGLFTQEQSQDIAKDLLFQICAVLDGSACAGHLNGDEIAPFVGFYLQHSTEHPLVPENGSGMHALVSDAIDDYYQNNEP
jgi:hypothetical protein